MPAERAPMRKVREVLRLSHALGVSINALTAVSVAVSDHTCSDSQPFHKLLNWVATISSYDAVFLVRPETWANRAVPSPAFCEIVAS